MDRDSRISAARKTGRKVWVPKQFCGEVIMRLPQGAYVLYEKETEKSVLLVFDKASASTVGKVINDSKR